MLPRRLISFISRSSSQRQTAGQPLVVFQIGRDQELLRLRAKIISRAGYTVQSMTPEQVHAEIGETADPRVWVFCHTLDFYEIALLAVAIRNSRPEDKLLRVAGLHDTGQIPGLFDELLEPVTGVDKLLRVVGALTRRPSVRKTV
jgi:nucleotidyltransferase/DNA polymerase involved in DNA repair